MKVQNHFLLGMALASFGMVACSNGGGGNHQDKSQQVVSEDLSGYAKASCLYKLDDGPKALTRGKAELETAAFGKKFDLSLLKPVLGSSAGEVIRFAQTTSVRYYKTSDYSTSGCQLLASLPDAPSDLEKAFTDFNKDGDVLGLYLPLHTKDVPATDLLAAITVREDANKWILVHEYMHHLFQLERDAEGDTKDAKEDFVEKAKIYDSASDGLTWSSSAQQSKAAAVALENLNISLQNTMKQYFLEEMAVETVLGNKLDQGSLQLVLSAQRINGAAYIVDSSDKAKKLMEQFKSATQDFEWEHNLTAQDRSDLDKSLTGYDDLENEMAKLKSQASAYLMTNVPNYHGFAAIPSSLQSNDVYSSHIGCSHTVEFEKAAEVVEAILEKHASSAL